MLRRFWPYAGFLAAGLVLGLGNFIYPYLSARDHLLGWTLCVSLPLAAATLRLAANPLASGARVPGWSTVWLVPACLACTLLLEWSAETWWPNSADEYGYVFLARTLLAGRLWNHAPPAPEIFEIAWTYVRDGKWFSQYPPAWPALLAPFLVLHAGWLANPLLTAVLCALMLATLRRLRVDPTLAAAVTALTAFSPFVLFNGASLFAHTLTAVIVVGVVWLQSREAAARSPANRAGIGALFGVLLLTRYDVFVLVAAPFVFDLLWTRRAAVLHDVPAMAAGGLPFAAAFMAYNHAFTGRLFKTPYAWASSGAHIGFWGKHVVFRDATTDAVLRVAHWAGELAAFTSLTLIGLVAIGTARKLRTRRLRWHDTLLALAIVFYFLYPANGGHEFGPRYWFFAWPAAMLTLATGLPSPAPGWLAAGRWRLHAPTLTAAHLAAFLGMAISTALFTRLYVDQRRLVEGVVPPRSPAVVLIPTRKLMLTRWQTEPIIAHSGDFCRNGISTDAGILYGRADNNFERAELFAASACAFTARPVFLWRAPGVMVEVPCR